MHTSHIMHVSMYIKFTWPKNECTNKQNARLIVRRSESKAGSTYIEIMSVPLHQRLYSVGEQQAEAFGNFLAWASDSDLPQAAETRLGQAYIDLVLMMQFLRGPGSDNVGELLAYLSRHDYDDLRGNPGHAVAMLRLADHCKLRDQYIHSFSHCCGMYGEVMCHAEFSVYTDLLTQTVCD